MTRKAPAATPSDSGTAAQVALHTTDVRLLSVDALVPNPWNPNRVPERTLAKIAAYLQREGFVKPLVVRPHPERAGEFQILDGEHRWRIAKEKLGLTTVPCVVVDVDEHRARVLTVNLNELGGEAAPEALAQLVHDLARDTSLADLESELPLSVRELEDHLALLKVPQGLALELDAEAAAHEDAAPKVLTFVVDDATQVEEAITRLAGGLEGRNRRGRALRLLAAAWLAQQPPAATATEPAA